MTKRRSIPDRWIDYSNVGTTIPGTRIIPFKTPLKSHCFEKMPFVERWTPKEVMNAIPNLGLVINLCYTDNPYYSTKDFEDTGVQYQWVRCRGHEVPTRSNVEQFTAIVEEFLSCEGSYDKLIGVHCTHGVNRTGYILCRYLVESLKIKPDVALNMFAVARNHEIERGNYVDALYVR